MMMKKVAAMILAILCVMASMTGCIQGTKKADCKITIEGVEVTLPPEYMKDHPAAVQAAGTIDGVLNLSIVKEGTFELVVLGEDNQSYTLEIKYEKEKVEVVCKEGLHVDCEVQLS